MRCSSLTRLGACSCLFQRRPTPKPVVAPLVPAMAPSLRPQAGFGLMAAGLLGVLACGGLAFRYSMASGDDVSLSPGAAAATYSRMSPPQPPSQQPPPAASALAPPPASAAAPATTIDAVAPAELSFTEVTYSRQPLWLQRPRNAPA